MATKSTGYNRSLCFIDDIYFCGIVKVVHVFTDFAVLTALICHQSICIIVCLLGSFKYSVHKKHYQATVVLFDVDIDLICRSDLDERPVLPEISPPVQQTEAAPSAR